MLRKYASADVLGVKGSATALGRTASLDKFAEYEDYRTDDGYLYVRVRAISSRVNKNHDGWPADELARAYRTFVGKPIFVDHHNHDPKRARGVIVDAKLHVEDMQKAASLDPYYATAPDNHKPPTWIELLLEVDAKRFPKLAKAIIENDIDSVSMGANVEESKCSHCANVASTPDQFCQHIRAKGAFFDLTDPHTGRKTSKRSYEDCYKVGFFEISFVFDPADETALAIPGSLKHAAVAAEVNAEGMEHTADVLTDHGFANIPTTFATVATAMGIGGMILKQKWDEFRARHGEAAANDPAVVKQALAEDEQVGHQGAVKEAVGAGVPEWFMLGSGLATLGAAGAAQASGLWNKYVQRYGDKPQNSSWLKQTLKSMIPGFTGDVSAMRPEGTPWQPPVVPGEPPRQAKTADRHNDPPQSEMTTAPDKVNTLRQEQVCPVCGSSMEDGMCEVCNYEEPPEGFDNPDLDKAQEVDQEMRQDQSQGQQATPIPAGADADAPLPQQGTPTPAAGMPTQSSTTTSSSSVSVTSDTPNGMSHTAADNDTSQGRVNVHEKPLLPATRATSDKPKGAQTVEDHREPVESNVKGASDMAEPQTKTADGASAWGGSDTAPDKRVEVDGVGSVMDKPLSDVDHQNVEKKVEVTGDPTSTFGDNGTPAVTNDTFPAKGDGVKAASDHTAGPAFPDHDPKRVDVTAPIAEPVGDPTKTFPTDPAHVGDPVTDESFPSAKDGVKAAHTAGRRHALASMKLAETEVELGIIPAGNKFDRIAELEGDTLAEIEAQQNTLARVRTAGLRKAATPKTAAAGRIPSMQGLRTAAVDPAEHSADTTDEAAADSQMLL